MESRLSEFTNLCRSKKASFVALYQKQKTGYFELVRDPVELVGLPIHHVFSMTKSFVGLVYVHLLLTKELFPEELFIGDVELFRLQIPNNKGMEKVRFVDLINHTSGLVSGVNKGKFNIDDAFFFLGNPSNDEVVKRVIHDFKTKGFTNSNGEKTDHPGLSPGYGTAPFAYNNYGSYLFGMFLEDIMRKEEMDAGNEPSWSIRRYAIDDMKLFGDLVEDDDFSWPLHAGVSVNIHSTAFAGIKTDGDNAAYIGRCILDTYKPLLEYIQGDKPVEYNGKIHVNRNRVKATAAQICATVSGEPAEEGEEGEKDEPEEKEKPMDYSYGFWIPLVKGRRVITMIGMLGQFIAWDLDNDLVAVRMHYVKLEDMKPKNRHRDFVWDAMECMWECLKL